MWFALISVGVLLVMWALLRDSRGLDYRSREVDAAMAEREFRATVQARRRRRAAAQARRAAEQDARQRRAQERRAGGDLPPAAGYAH
ncbi:hypothetical protein [Gordonia sp. NB41Y]|uniref:hypothetical protein n=1 Tax=Gordonia sp. NB41Y TaxID=875808 RepID=UPI00128FBE49|nr:hypothetical protein [Gordonia sp. NB41Y]WLP90488.1 hypothetical protein Q9K23_23790 [Gordonia sp. NB41Y]